MLSSCGQEGVIPPDDMVSLLTEMYVIDGCIEASDNRPEGLDSLEVYAPVIEKYGYVKDDFRNALNFYLHHPSDLSKIYSKVQKKLESSGKKIDISDNEELPDVLEEPDLGFDKVADDEPGDIVPENRHEDKPKETTRRNSRKKLSKKELKELEKSLEE